MSSIGRRCFVIEFFEHSKMLHKTLRHWIAKHGNNFYCFFLQLISCCSHRQQSKMMLVINYVNVFSPSFLKFGSLPASSVSLLLPCGKHFKNLALLGVIESLSLSNGIESIWLSLLNCLSSLMDLRFQNLKFVSCFEI